MANSGSVYEAEIAAGQLRDLVSSGTISNQEVELIAREATEGVSAPAIAAREAWRSTIGASIAMAKGCRAFWKNGALTFIGGGATEALSTYMRAVVEVDVHAVVSFRTEKDRLSIRAPFGGFGGFGLGDLLGGDVADQEAFLLWMDLFRNAFARAVSESLVGKVDHHPVEARTRASSTQGAHGAALPEFVHMRALLDKLSGDVFKVALVAERAEWLGAAAGADWRIERRKMLMECVTCKELQETMGRELAEARRVLALREQDLVLRESIHGLALRSAQQEAQQVQTMRDGLASALRELAEAQRQLREREEAQREERFTLGGLLPRPSAAPSPSPPPPKPLLEID